MAPALLTLTLAAPVVGCGTASEPAAVLPSTVPSAESPTERGTAPAPGSVTTGTQQPRMVQAVATARFTQPWGCGHGFHATTADRTVALQLWQQGPRSSAGSYTVRFPDPAWRAEAQLGQDLLTVDCADLDVTRPPDPDETWPVVGGTLEYTAPAFGGCGASVVATGVARDLEVRTPDGGTVTYAELRLTNDQWGCSAG